MFHVQCSMFNDFYTFASTMSTVIYPSPIFGPIHSRRLGISLGINLQPADGKVCSFDCIYCECGFNSDHRPTLSRPSRQLVAQKLEEQLQKMVADKQLPDVLTFAGNGEPTSHPHFAEIIDDTIRLRDQYCPQAKVCVLSNATMTHRPQVHDALMRVDDNILKLDTVNPDYIRLVDRPVGHYDVRQIIDNLKAFHGHVIIQTMFMRGTFNVPTSSARAANVQCSMFNVQSSTFNVDNTGEAFVAPWLEAVKEIQPQQVMVYTIDRETPAHGLLKATHEQLDAIRDRVIALGIPCTASY
ncbi:Radical SAM superfamily protein [Prevotellaceae bacterium HUN156]|nr:Radical SAM superfamily protein [Prevotellaceae bacterium HUN156]